MAVQGQTHDKQRQLMNFKLHMPIYLQIEDHLKMEIALGHLLPGDQLPSVRDFSSVLKVNPNTVQRAFQSLEEEGICTSQRGLGRFVSQAQDLPKRLKLSMLSQRTLEYLEAIKPLELDQEAVLTVIRAHLSGADSTIQKEINRQEEA